MDAGEMIQKSVFWMKPGIYIWCDLLQVKAGLAMRLLKCGIYHGLRSAVAEQHLQHSDIKTV